MHQPKIINPSQTIFNDRDNSASINWRNRDYLHWHLWFLGGNYLTNRWKSDHRWKTFPNFVQSWLWVALFTSSFLYQRPKWSSGNRWKHLMIPVSYASNCTPQPKLIPVISWQHWQLLLQICQFHSSVTHLPLSVSKQWQPYAVHSEK